MDSKRRKKKGRVTVKDVAALAGVHPSTVSRALTIGTKRVTPELVARVTEAAKQLSYRPNRLARALRVERSSSVGMLIPDISNPAYPPIVRGVEDALRVARIPVLLASTDNDPSREAELIALMLDQRVDGLLLATATRKYAPLQTLLAADLPVVLINRCPEKTSLPLVRGDDDRGIELAVRHLASLGHTHIAHLAGTDTVSSGNARRLAFIRTIKALGLAHEPGLIVSADQFKGPVGIELGMALTRELIRRDLPFTSVVAANDLLAIGCYKVLDSVHLRIPEDVSVIGYNDVSLVDGLSPPLTTVHNPLYEIGFRAGHAILDRMRGTQGPIEHMTLAPTLVVRRSTAPPPSPAAKRRVRLPREIRRKTAASSN
ncbi:MAG: LacI family DNA-binding transcriptional regulator [Casimicrobiaceae bacterium]